MSQLDNEDVWQLFIEDPAEGYGQFKEFAPSIGEEMPNPATCRRSPVSRRLEERNLGVCRGNEMYGEIGHEYLDRSVWGAGPRSVTRPAPFGTVADS
jgi:hypothetical protein